jgi:hypothetical protein
LCREEEEKGYVEETDESCDCDPSSPRAEAWEAVAEVFVNSG